MKQLDGLAVITKVFSRQFKVDDRGRKKILAREVVRKITVWPTDRNNQGGLLRGDGQPFLNWEPVLSVLSGHLL